MKKFDAEASKKLAESYAHRGALPPEMGSRWDAQGAFIAGQRLMFEKLMAEVEQLNSLDKFMDENAKLFQDLVNGED